MKAIGLIGCMSWESMIPYYCRIIQWLVEQEGMQAAADFRLEMK